MKSPHSKLRSLVAIALACGAMAALSGCIMGEDSGEPPLLAVDFFWDDDTRNGDDTCASAEVGSMDWQLSDDHDGHLVDERESDCNDGFNFHGVGPGTYTLKVNGYDRDHNKRWEGTCRLFLDRFDRAYPCDLGRVSE